MFTNVVYLHISRIFASVGKRENASPSSLNKPLNRGQWHWTWMEILEQLPLITPYYYYLWRKYFSSYSASYFWFWRRKREKKRMRQICSFFPDFLFKKGYGNYFRQWPTSGILIRCREIGLDRSFLCCYISRYVS